MPCSYFHALCVYCSVFNHYTFNILALLVSLRININGVAMNKHVHRCDERISKHIEIQNDNNNTGWLERKIPLLNGEKSEWQRQENTNAIR